MPFKNPKETYSLQEWQEKKPEEIAAIVAENTSVEKAKEFLVALIAKGIINLQGDAIENTIYELTFGRVKIGEPNAARVSTDGVAKAATA